jgi:two-component system response regulator LytT
MNKRSYKKILIIEDEAAAARRLIRMLQEIDSTIQVIDILETVKDSVNFLNSVYSPDLILMDIHLADGSCFEIFQKVDIKVPVIFITAYDHYAIQAFRLNGLDYLLKPVKKTELEESLSRFKSLLQSLDIQKVIEQLIVKPVEFQKRFLVKSGNFIKAIEIEDIAFFYAEEKAVFIYSFQKERHLVDFTLDKIESFVDPVLFFRINRSIIISNKVIGKNVIIFSG